MRFHCTSNTFQAVPLFEAVTTGFAPDGSLYLPTQLPFLTPDEIRSFRGCSLEAVCFFLMKRLLSEDFSEEEIFLLVQESFTFPTPLIAFPEEMYGLELFHGPTLSFKDFGARFFACLIKRLWKEEKPLHILVATTGDTGSAIGAAFHGIPHAHVTILFPKGKVTPSQEKQLTTLGSTVTALEINGTFDACQMLLKQALLDPTLRKELALTTGNSINVARLLPQTLYFFYAYSCMKTSAPLIASVPCGNFGHLVSAILAKRMGLPIARFVAATNINDEVPLFLKSGVFSPHASWPSIAVSMDVGNPSNFPRLLSLYQGSLELIRNDMVGMSFSDDEIRQGIQELYRQTRYILDPHASVSYLALRRYLSGERNGHQGLFLLTAHPAKFPENIEPLIGKPIAIPARLETALKGKKEAISLSDDYLEFKEFLLHRRHSSGM